MLHVLPEMVCYYYYGNDSDDYNNICILKGVKCKVFTTVIGFFIGGILIVTLLVPLILWIVVRSQGGELHKVYSDLDHCLSLDMSCDPGGIMENLFISALTTTIITFMIVIILTVLTVTLKYHNQKRTLKTEQELVELENKVLYDIKLIK